ncbi:MAG: hypothetical protein HY059_18470 [Proteobacteria bacterium]|nr:hypothetical protein [Pseudomonadota bacterium]
MPDAQGGFRVLGDGPPAPQESQPPPPTSAHEVASRVVGQCAQPPADGYSARFLDCVSATGTTGVGGAECEAAAFCSATPERAAEWREMNARHNALHARLRSSQAPHEDLLRQAWELESHPLYTDLRRNETRATLSDLARRALLRRLNRNSTRAALAANVWLRTGDLRELRLHLHAMGVRHDAVRGIVRQFEGSGAGRGDLTVEPTHAPSPVQVQADAELHPDRARMVILYEGARSHGEFLAELLRARAEHFPNVPLEVIAQNPGIAARLAAQARSLGLGEAGLLGVGFRSCGGRACPGRYNTWARDGYLLVHGPSGSRLLLPARPIDFVRDAGLNVMATFPGLQTASSRVHWEGGTIVSAPGRTFVSEHVLGLNPDMNRRRIEHLLASETGQPVTIIPNLPGLAHIDLYVTPLGGNRVLVGDARLAWSSIDAAIQADPSSQSSIHRLIAGRRGDTSDMVSSELRDAIVAARSRDARNAVILDDIAARLAASGFQVDRVPFVGGVIGDEPVLTYNNTIQIGNRVMMGRYGIAALDDAAAAVYRRNGLAPVQLSALPLARLGGGIHCMINFLPRSPASHRMLEYEAEILAAQRHSVPPVPAIGPR